jgi:hypothetical protein
MDEHTCEDCAMSFASSAELEAHQQSCLLRRWRERAYRDQEPVFDAYGDDDGWLERTATPPTLRCEFCWRGLEAQEELDAHLEECLAKRWWDQTHGMSEGSFTPPPELAEAGAGEAIAAAVDLEVGGARAGETLAALRESALALQDDEASHLCRRGLDLVADALLALADAPSGARPDEELGRRLLRTAAQLAQLAEHRDRYRRLLTRFDRAEIAQELAELDDDRLSAAPDMLLDKMRRQKAQLLSDIDEMEQTHALLGLRLASLVDAVTHVYLRLQRLLCLIGQGRGEQLTASLQEVADEIDALIEVDLLVR